MRFLVLSSQLDMEYVEEDSHSRHHRHVLAQVADVERGRNGIGVLEIALVVPD